MEEQIVRKTEGILKFLERKNDKLQPVELWCLNEKTNRNGWQYQSIATHLDEFKNIPILTAYLMNGAVISDGHNFDLKRDKNGNEYASFTAADAERIVGWIDEDASVSIQKDENGIDWVVCKGNLWAFYCHELVQKLRDQGLEGMSVSIETLVTSEDIIDGVAYEKDYIVLGVTILGDDVQPAVESASIRTLSQLSIIRNAMEETILKAASYNEDSKQVNEHETEKNTFTRSVKTLTYFSKKQCSELSKRFEEAGYTVLAAAQNDEDNSINIALLSKTGETAVYNMNSVDETIAVERIKACDGKVAFENGLEVSFETATERMSAEIGKACAERDEAKASEQKVNESLTAAMATVTDMRNRENARRIQSAKSCAASVLKAYNQYSEHKVSEKVLEAINSDIDNGMYTEKVNEKGDWVGEAEVEMRVKALCADEAMKANKSAAEKNQNIYIWEKLNNSSEDDGSVGALLKKMGIE